MVFSEGANPAGIAQAGELATQHQHPGLAQRLRHQIAA
jgi:hypothetical protein